MFPELLPTIVSVAEPPFAFLIIASYAIPIRPSPAPKALSRSVSDWEESNSAQYSVIVSIQSKILDNENMEADISPGMIAQVDIIRGRRTILEYFWQPVAKIKETAFKE